MKLKLKSNTGLLASAVLAAGVIVAAAINGTSRRQLADAQYVRSLF